MQSSQQINPKIINTLAKQQAELAKDAPDGVIFYQNEEGDLTDIQADIVGPFDTPFAGGVFRCKLVIDGEFPQKPPKGYFLTKIFHPNVAQPSGDICVNTLKRDWNPQKWSLSHIFQIIKCLLIVPFPESALNEEAGRLFITSYDEFSNQARLYTQIHAKPNAKQVQLIGEMQQKQKTKKISNQQKNVDEGQSVEAQMISPSKLEMPQLGLQKTFSLGQATQQAQQQQPMAIGAGGQSSQINSAGSNFGVLGLSQVTNSMNPGLLAGSNQQLTSQSQFSSFGAKTSGIIEDKQLNNAAGGFGTLNSFGGFGGGENSQMQGSQPNSLFGCSDQNGNVKFGGMDSQETQGQMNSTQDTTMSAGMMGNGFGGFGSNQDIGFGMSMGLGIGLGNQGSSQGSNLMMAGGVQEQSRGFQDSQNSLSTMQNIGMTQPMGGNAMINPQKNKKKIGGKCRI